MTLVPNSWGSAPLREFNQCHSPADGKFCSAPGDGSDAIAAIQRGEAYKATEDQFLKYHLTGNIPSNSYERYESGDLGFIVRGEFDTLVSRTMINGEPVEIRLQSEPAKYGKRKEGASEAERDRLYAEYQAAAQALGTNPMSAGLDLGRDSAQYKALDVYAKRWLDSGSDWVRDAHGNVAYYSPEEMKAKGLAPVTYTVGAFVGDRTVGYAGDEFGASGVYVARAYQRQGLGLTLLKTYLEKSGRLVAGQKFGQMTSAGQQLVRRLHRQLVKEQPR